MIEQAMIFALGACVAGLLALLCLPAIARRALRMAQVAVERQMPISVDEIVAQRDLLRAEFATERRRLEQTLEDAQTAQARDMAENGRRLADIARLGADLSSMTTARDTAAAAATLAERLLRETTAENIGLQKALYDSDGDGERLRGLLAMLTGEHTALTAAGADKQATIAQLTADLADGATQRDALVRDLSQAQLDLSVASARAEALQAQIDNHAETIRAGQGTEAHLRGQIEEAARKSEETLQMAEDMAMLRRTIVEIGREVVRLAADQPAPTPREHDEIRTPVSVN